MQLNATNKTSPYFFGSNRCSRTFLAMKIATFILMASITVASAKSYSQNVTLTMKNARMELVFSKIEQLSGYSFIYEKKILKKIGKLDVSFNNKPLEEAIQILLKNYPFDYIIRNKFVVISPKAVQLKLTLPNQLALLTKITGVVKDTAGLALPNVSILNQNTGKGTTTNTEGTFTIDANPGDILIFSLIGFQKREVKIGVQTKLDIELREEKSQLDQVVVTALGIKKQTRALTYNVQEIKGEELTRNKDANFVNALTGKVAGVTINASSAGIGGATRVVMRGTKSISGNNNALYVVDGIPIPNTSGGQVSGPFVSSVSGEGISSINPDDIESISALTGPSATALYGNQGANGVILVTTKKGAVGKMKINLNNKTDFFSPFVMPKFQNTYGQENDLQMSSWGQKLETPSSYNPKDFFELGYNINNSLSLSGGTEKSQTFLSIGTNNANGIIRNNEYNRYNFYLRHTASLTEKLILDFGAMYVKTDDNNMISQGQYQNPLVPIYLFPSGDDIKKYEVYSRYNPDRKINTQFWPFQDQGLGMQNPYWITDAQSKRNKTDRYMFNATAKYKVLDWLDIVGRVRIDNSNTESEEKRPAGTSGLFASEFGYYTSGKSISKNTYIDLIASAKRQLNPDLILNANVGGSYQDDKMDGIYAGGNLIRLANFYSIQENTNNIPQQTYLHTQLQSVFGTVELDYKKVLFLNATGRQEWPSRLAISNQKTYFYPSVGVSGIISDIFKMPEAISFVKLRASYAEVGNPPNLQTPVYSLTDPSMFRPAPFPEFQPERTKSYELGMELKFLKNKLSLNATVYRSNTTNQLLSQPITTGGIYSIFYYNAGDIQNQGIEASLGYNANIGNISWSSTAIFTLNRNKVKRLSEGFVNQLGEITSTDDMLVGSMGDLENILSVGGSTADLYVTQAIREDNQGNPWVDPGNSNIEKMTIPRRFIGRYTPDYNISWSNSLSYKNFGISFLIDARIGGVGISYTQAVMDAYGVSEKSALDRDKGGVDIYGIQYTDVKKFYELLGSASGSSMGMSAYYVYSATNVRLREASISYTIPAKILKGKLEHIKISATGRNLFMFYNKAPFDPESTSSTGTYDQGIDYFRQPSYRSFGFSLSAKF